RPLAPGARSDTVVPSPVQVYRSTAGERGNGGDGRNSAEEGNRAGACSRPRARSASSQASNPEGTRPLEASRLRAALVASESAYSFCGCPSCPRTQRQETL